MCALDARVTKRLKSICKGDLIRALALLHEEFDALIKGAVLIKALYCVYREGASNGNGLVNVRSNGLGRISFRD